MRLFYLIVRSQYVDLICLFHPPCPCVEQVRRVKLPSQISDSYPLPTMNLSGGLVYTLGLVKTAK